MSITFCCTIAACLVDFYSKKGSPFDSYCFPINIESILVVHVYVGSLESPAGVSYPPQWLVEVY